MGRSLFEINRLFSLLATTAVIVGLTAASAVAQKDEEAAPKASRSAAAKSSSSKGATKSSPKTTSAKKSNAAASSDKSAAKDKVTGRLPAYYASVVDEKQREEIYALQALHGKQIDALKEQLREMVAERDAEIRAVLSTAQQKKLDEVIAKSRESRRASAAKRTTAVAASTAEE